MNEIKLHLPDMSCGHCVAAITETVKGLDPAAELDFEREAKNLSVRSAALTQPQLAEALSEAGYPPA